MDWKKIGLKVGLEIHQQLDTSKLFCSCPSDLKDVEPEYKVIRRLKAVKGELSQLDVAAKAEEGKKKTYVYLGNSYNTCLVELDEEPPHEVNKEALKVAIQVAKLLNMKFFDEIFFMRKTVLDGSNTSGFQRTALIAEDGFIETSSGKVRVSSLALEEDSARKVKEEGNFVYYNLDRLGIPLIELRTEPDIKTPEQAKEAAERLGLLMRMTGKVKRGIGTIRQDVNISIKGGARIEIKGFQDLSLMPKIIEMEVERQLNIIDLKKELKKRKAKAIFDPIDIKEIFISTESKLINSAIERGDSIIATKLSGFSGFLKKKLCGEKTLAKDVVDYLRVLIGFKGFIHSDELPKYGISEEEVNKIKEKLGCSENDAFAFLTGEEEKVKKGLSLIVERLNQYLKGVPKEVRKANEDGTTSFLRPMPGAARMYPETDVPSVKLNKKYLSEIKAPLTPEERLEMYKKWGLSEDLSMQMIRSKVFIPFENFVGKFKNVQPKFIANLLLSVKDDLRKRYSAPVENLEERHFEETLSLLNEGKITKSAVEEILSYLSRYPTFSAEEAAEKLSLWKMSEKELDELIEKVLSENKELVEKKEFKILMGLVMRKVRGRIDGELVAKKLKEALKV